MLENLILMISAYNSDANLELIIKAFNYGERAHENQYRKSGEKYFVHPIEVAKILAELEMDESTIAAGLLHDVLEDTGITYAQMAKDFSVEIADLVDGVTKLGKLSYKTKEETQAENLRKMFMAMGKDIRVILIKLADRLHNMRTLKYMNEEKAKEKALETVEIFVPIAHRLGISKIKWEMEDIALRYIDPTGYYDLVEKVLVKKVERENFIKKLIDLLHTKLKEVSINDADISGRAKHFYSIYKKMKNQNKIFDEIYDLMAVRIIVDDIKDCYGALGVVHTIWKPMPGRFKDYIAMPKPNMYQSIHTTVIGSDGLPFEIQIRTKEMHKVAEFGIAAHWKYKEGKSASAGTDMDDKLAWLRQMMEWQKDVSDSKEFMDSVKLDLFTDEVFVFTPKGEVVELAAESTPLDFAYKVHTGVGNRCVGAKVDGKIVPLDFQLNSGNIVEILTSANSSGPSRDWLNIVKSSHARNKIRQWFKKERREENIEKGREMLERETKRNGFPLSDFLKTKYLTAILKPLSQNAIEDLYAALGYGGLTMGQVFPKIKEKYEVDHKLIKEEKIEKLEDVKLASKLPIKKPQSSTGDSGVSVKGIDNILIRFAKCCNPLPGDDIIGYITKGRGVSVHRTDCAQINLDDREKVVDVIWNSEDLSKKNFEVEIQIDADDRRGLFMDVSKFLADEKIAVNGINARSAKDGTAIMNIIIEVQSKEQLKSIKNKIRRIEGVVGAFRV